MSLMCQKMMLIRQTRQLRTTTHGFCLTLQCRSNTNTLRLHWGIARVYGMQLFYSKSGCISDNLTLYELLPSLIILISYYTVATGS